MKLSKEETKSSQFNQFSNLKVSLSNAVNFRPISAVNKRPDKYSTFKVSKNNLPTSIKPNLTDFNNIFSAKNQIPSLYNLDKEKLYEDNLQLKEIINTLRRELSFAKSENFKKEKEMNKKDKVIEDIAYGYDGSSGILGAIFSADLYNKTKETNLIIKIKKQHKELKNEFKGKCKEIENLKKLSNITKFNELTTEIKTTTEEMIKIKTLYIDSLKQNECNESNLKELQTLKDNFSKQHLIILTLQENLGKLYEEMKSKVEEISKLNDMNNQKLEQIKKLKKDLIISTQLNDKLIKEKINNTETNHLKTKYESQITDIVKEMNRYRNISEKRDRQVRELESNIKRITTEENKKENTMIFNHNEIKYIQENPEEKFDNITLLLKSKLKEQISEKEKLKKLINLYKKKIEIYEKKLGYKIEDEMLNAEGMSLGDTPENKDMEENMNENMKENMNDNINKRLKSNSNPKYGSNSNSNYFNLNKNENEENDPLKSNYFTEDQLTEFTYILIKNFEAKKFTKQIVNDKIIKDIFTSRTSSKSQVKEILSKISNKIISVLNLILEEDKKRISIFVQTLFSLSDKNLDIFKDKFLSLFYNVKLYTNEEEINFSKKLKKYLSNNMEHLKKLIGLKDGKKTGLITFINLRKILESINLMLKDKFIEYLIYKMKSFDETGKASIYDLKYQIMYDVIENAENDDSKNISSEEESEGLIRNVEELSQGKEHSEIIITTDQFNEKINNFLKSIYNYLKINKLGIRDLFEGEIFKANQISLDDELKNIDDEFIDLKLFLERTKRIGIKMSNLDVYCIYTKYKIIDDFEAISLTILEKELTKLTLGSNTFASEITSKNEDNLPQVNEDEEDFSRRSYDFLESENEMNSGFVSERIENKGVNQIDDGF